MRASARIVHGSSIVSRQRAGGWRLGRWSSCGWRSSAGEASPGWESGCAQTGARPRPGGGAGAGAKLCEEDITLLGEQLRRLDAETAAHPLDDAARVDYQTALDAYESAQRTVRRITDADEISKVTDTLSERALRPRVRAGPGRRPAPAGAAGALLLQPAARAVGDRRAVHSAGPRHPQGARVRDGRRASQGRREAGDPRGRDRRSAGAVLRGRVGLRAVRPGLLPRCGRHAVTVHAARHRSE